MNKDKKFTLGEMSQIMFNLMYGKKRMNIIQAYSAIKFKYKTDYSYDEIKDYLFHHKLKVTEE